MKEVMVRLCIKVPVEISDEEYSFFDAEPPKGKDNFQEVRDFWKQRDNLAESIRERMGDIDQSKLEVYAITEDEDECNFIYEL